MKTSRIVRQASHLLSTIHSPATLAPISTINLSDVSTVHSAVQAANDAFASWSTTTPEYRSSILFKIASSIEHHLPKLAEIESANCGKPIHEAQFEIQGSADCFRYFGALALTSPSALYSQGASGYHYTLDNPVGVCALISSFNYPMMLLAWKLAPALAAGCTTVIKPSEFTPLSTLYFMEHVAKDAQLPSGVANVVVGGAEVGSTLVEHEHVHHVSFTGSVPTGKRIQKAVTNTETFKHVSLELGGKSAAIVLEDADMDTTVEHVFQAAFSNAGQNCCAGSRLFVHKNVYDELLSKLSERVEQCKLGVQEDCDFGPLVNEMHLKRVQGMVERAVSELGDSTQVIQTKNVPAKGYYHPATILTNVPDASYIAQNEVFGPVLSLMKPFDSVESAIQRGNSTPFALAGGVFGKNRANTDAVIHGLKCGYMWVNTWNMMPAWLPFGAGVRSVSGIGKELGPEGLKEFTAAKSVYLNQG